MYGGLQTALRWSKAISILIWTEQIDFQLLTDIWFREVVHISRGHNKQATECWSEICSKHRSSRVFPETYNRPSRNGRIAPHQAAECASGTLFLVLLLTPRTELVSRAAESRYVVSITVWRESLLAWPKPFQWSIRTELPCGTKQPIKVQRKPIDTTWVQYNNRSNARSNSAQHFENITLLNNTTISWHTFVTLF